MAFNFTISGELIKRLRGYTTVGGGVKGPRGWLRPEKHECCGPL